MSVTEVKAMECACERCGHRWTPRVVEGLPMICPKCKSAYWNKPRRKPAAKVTSQRLARKEKREGSGGP